MIKNNYKLINANTYFSYVLRNKPCSLITLNWVSVLVFKIKQNFILYNEKFKHVKYGKLKLPIFACFIMDG